MLKLTRPLHLLLAALTYALGASLPAYLGKPLNLLALWSGLASVLLLQAALALLTEVFRPGNEPLLQGETPQRKETLRNNALYVSLAALAAVAFLVYQLYLNGALAWAGFTFYLFSFGLILLYAVPPIRLVNRGFGELLLAAHLAYLVPAIGFTLQFGENHRMLIFALVPLTALALAYFLILNFTTYENDQKYERGSLLRALGWERAVPLHDSLLIFAYAAFTLAAFFGYRVLWTSLLTLPFAALQIVLLRNVALGGKPNWQALASTALAVFGLTAYFLALTFWLR